MESTYGLHTQGNGHLQGDMDIPLFNPYYVDVGQNPTNVSQLWSISKGGHSGKFCMGNDTFLAY
jgi:hypothetical protein